MQGSFAISGQKVAKSDRKVVFYDRKVTILVTFLDISDTFLTKYRSSDGSSEKWSKVSLLHPFLIVDSIPETASKQGGTSKSGRKGAVL